ncbi:MAG: hypothetical protein M1829_003661 [Trizodia sp. TS-e1964]|nr:MAG: hypothetical protein M1829_003661 [Trizodia sp. TS-e1964]
MPASPPAHAPPSPSTAPQLARIRIHYCVKCQWLLRAAYHAQELLSTFGAQLREVALVPAPAGGVFRVELVMELDAATSRSLTLWDRAVDGGFPGAFCVCFGELRRKGWLMVRVCVDTKVLKCRVRDCIDPARVLGHVDRARVRGKAGERAGEMAAGVVEQKGQGDVEAVVGDCVDCAVPEGK